MANPVVAQIVKSGAVLWNAPVGEALPDETTVAYGAAWGGNWTRVGYTKKPLTVAITKEEFDVEVEEELSAVRRFVVKEAEVWETELAELAAAYIELTLGGEGTTTTTAAGAGQVAYEEWKGGGVIKLDEKCWGIEGLYLDANGVSFPIRYWLLKATATINGNLEFSQKTTDYVGIPIQLKALCDTSKAAGLKLRQFQRVTAAATS